MCLLCNPGMKATERPCMKKYDYMDVLRWEERGKQRAFERRLKKASTSDALHLLLVVCAVLLVAGVLIYAHYH